MLTPDLLRTTLLNEKKKASTITSRTKGRLRDPTREGKNQPQRGKIQKEPGGGSLCTPYPLRKHKASQKCHKRADPEKGKRGRNSHTRSEGGQKSRERVHIVNKTVPLRRKEKRLSIPKENFFSGDPTWSIRRPNPSYQQYT